MTDKDLIKKIKGLEKIKPTEKWLSSLRHNLVTQIDFEEDFHFSFNWIKQPQTVALVVCLVFIFFGGPWLSMKASQSSLPGELLYSVKKIGEGVQSTVASDSGKVNLQAKFASRRLEELDKIANDSFSPEEKTEKTKKIINGFKDNLAQISQNVGKVSKEGIVAVAQKTKKMEESLDKIELDELAEAEEAIEEVSKILAALIEDGEQGDDEDIASSTDKEILIFLEDNTETTTPQIIEE